MTIEELQIRKRRATAEISVLEKIISLKDESLRRHESYRTEIEEATKNGDNIDSWIKDMVDEYAWETATFNKIIDHFEEIINEKKWRL